MTSAWLCLQKLASILNLPITLLFALTTTAVLACSEKVSPRSSPNGMNILTMIDESVLERDRPVFINARCLCSVSEEMGKPGSDAGMPGIEDSEVGKIDEAQFGNANCQKLLLFLKNKAFQVKLDPIEHFMVMNGKMSIVCKLKF